MILAVCVCVKAKNTYFRESNTGYENFYLIEPTNMQPNSCSIPMFFTKFLNIRHSIIYEICMHLIIFRARSVLFSLIPSPQEQFNYTNIDFVETKLYFTNGQT